MNHQHKISDALSALLQRQNEDAFVIIEDSRTNKFVQFARTDDGLLLLDLPAVALTETEFEKATQFFEQRGVVGQEHELLSEPDGVAVDSIFTFNVEYESVSEATKTVEEIFKSVFGIKAGSGFRINEN